MYGVTMMMVLIAAGVFLVLLLASTILFSFMSATQAWKRRHTTLDKIIRTDKKTHSVGPDTPVSECVQLMTKAKIGSLVILDGEKLAGIFTERDALNKVLAGGLDPARTKVSQVMTTDPFCIPAGTTVGDALKLISERRFRHLPVIDEGRFITVVSSGDLTHWLVGERSSKMGGTTDLAVGT